VLLHRFRAKAAEELSNIPSVLPKAAHPADFPKAVQQHRTPKRKRRGDAVCDYRGNSERNFRSAPSAKTLPMNETAFFTD
jgi:hypothetical protein